jgi:hypothetical protein
MMSMDQKQQLITPKRRTRGTMRTGPIIIPARTAGIWFFCEIGGFGFWDGGVKY